MIISVNTKEFEVPDTIDLSDLTEQGGWLFDIFQEVANLKKTGQGIWSYVFTTMFQDEQLTEMHKYCICMAFSALITSLELSEQFHGYIDITLPKTIQQTAKTVFPFLYYAREFATPVITEQDTTEKPSESFVPM